MNINKVATARLLEELENRKFYKCEYMYENAEDEYREKIRNKAAEAACALDFDASIYIFRADHTGNGIWKVSISRGEEVLLSWEVIIDRDYDFRDHRFDSVYEKSKEFFSEIRKAAINKAMENIGSTERWLHS